MSSIITPNGTKVQLKEYLTGRDIQEIEAVLFESVEIGSDGRPKSFNPNAVQKQVNKAISIAVVSINDNKENVLDGILDLPARDYKTVCNAVDSLRTLDVEKKTN